MSSDWAPSDAEVETPRGRVTARCIVAWVHCDRCDAGVSTVGVPADAGDGIAAELADAEGYERHDGVDLCPTCAKGGAR